MNEERIPVALTEAEWVQVANIIQKEPLKDVFSIFMNMDQQIGQFKQQQAMAAQMAAQAKEAPQAEVEGPEEK